MPFKKLWQAFKRIFRRKYKNPGLVELDREMVSASGPTFKHSSPKTKQVLFERTVNIEQLELMLHLNKIGLNVERPFLDQKGNPVLKRLPDGKINVFSESKGKTLHDLFLSGKPSKKVAVKILTQVAELLARIHEEGFVHGHPHSENITWDGRRVALIDFKSAKPYSEQEKLADIYLFLELIHDLGLTGKERKVLKAVNKLYDSTPKKPKQ